jgi:hypothetical protein
MKKLLLGLLMATFAGRLYCANDLNVYYTSYIIGENKNIRLFEKGPMHRKIFQWTCEMHPQLKEYTNKYDSLSKFEVYIRNDCAKISQMVVLTLYSGKKVHIKVDNYIVYTNFIDSRGRMVVKKYGKFVPDALIAKYAVVSSGDITLASLNW